ncbi:urokinase plasminogen activator surface receptor-like [Actinia tenebrosa]|uniref:Urokinase plasminogen activator surface receptor-like n=1 Tax=Actinia tenebrosa TaxID=6105 RepID=A0A6P8IER9_ACTTE|nr:urokinase plasminogen activator surface receptor-like [Actinia tenebrosa]
MTCCNTSSCNSDSSGGSSSNPSCYTCVSTSSYQDCENKAILTRCSSTTSYCYKMDYKLSSSSDREGSIYKKGCIADASSCSQLRSNYLSSILIDECNVYCCTGSGCNAGSVQQFSVVILMTCAVVFFISQNLFFLPLDTQL